MSDCRGKGSAPAFAGSSPEVDHWTLPHLQPALEAQCLGGCEEQSPW